VNRAMHCCVCFDESLPTDHTLPCGHQFHASCITEWFRSNHEAHGCCPTCRSNPVASLDEDSTTRLSTTMAKYVLSSALAKGSNPVVRRIKKEYDQVCKDQRQHSLNVRIFQSENRQVISKFRRQERRSDSLIRKKRKIMKAACSLHPIVPLKVEIFSGEGQDITF
jgi:hypothetical protein